jgi:hypothetical protein
LSKVRRHVPRLELLEDRIVPAGRNVCVQANPYVIEDLTPQGNLLSTINVPHQSLNQMQDFIVGGNGDLYVVRGPDSTGGPAVLSVLSPSGSWTDYTDPGWSGQNGVASYGNFVFATSLNAGLLRFDAGNGFQVQHFGGGPGYDQLTVGLDGLLYAIDHGTTSGHQQIEVYDPSTLTLLHTITINLPIADVAVDKAGNIFAIGGSDSVYEYDASGNPLATATMALPNTEDGPQDINLAPDGTIIVGAEIGPTEIRGFYLGDTSLASFKWVPTVTQNNTDVEPYVAFAPQDYLDLTGYTSPVAAGVSDTFTVTARHPDSTPIAAYADSVELSSSDPQAVFIDKTTGMPLTNNIYTFTGAEGGQHDFQVIFKTPGTQTILAADQVTTADVVSGLASIVVKAGPTTQLVVAGFPSTTTAGVLQSFTVTAEDALGNVTTDYLGTAEFSSSDGYAFLPASYAFTAADDGQHTFQGALNTPGTQSLTATDSVNPGVTGTEPNITVNAGTSVGLTLQGLLPVITAGANNVVSVSLLNSAGQLDTLYRGTVHFTSDDPQAVLPQDYTFTSSDSGQRDFNLKFRTAGIHTLKVSDVVNPALNDHESATVVADAASMFTIAGLSGPITAGTSTVFFVNARDQFGNLSTQYRGTVHFTSTDDQALLPDDGTFTASDSGTRAFAVTFKTAGTRTLTVRDTTTPSIAGAGNAPIIAAAASQFAITGPDSTVAGAGLLATVTARDPYGNLATTYLGKVHFTGGDPLATLPLDYSFTATDNGAHNFSMILDIAGTSKVTCTDTAHPALTGTGTFTVTPGPAASFDVAGPPTPVAAGAAAGVTITGRDAFNNVASGYTGAVHFTSTDLAAVLPDDYTFTSADAGQHTFAPVFKTAGNRDIKVADTAPGSTVSGNTTVTVAPGPLGSFRMGGLPITLTAGTQASVAVTAFDAYGNIASNYRGSTIFTSNDTLADLPGSYAFTTSDAGMHAFHVTLKKAGTRTVTVADSVATSITASQQAVVGPAAQSQFAVVGLPMPLTAGTSVTFSAQAQDPYGNVTPSYHGTVQFGSTDTQSTITNVYTFVAGDSGKHSFTATLRTAGNQSITLTDVTFSGGGSTTVAPAAAAKLLVDLPAHATAGTPFDATVTAIDAFNNIATQYTGTVHWTGGDGQAALPGDYAFTAGDQGSHVFSIAQGIAALRQLSATDTVNGDVAGNGSVTIDPGAAASLTLKGFPNPLILGGVGSFTVTAYDAFGNQASGYGGTVSFTSSDPQANLPPSYTFMAADAGTHDFNANPYSAGVQSLSVTDAVNGLSATQSGIMVNYAAPVLTSLDINSAVEGSGNLNLTLTGSSFAPASVARWNGAALVTTYVDGQHLQATVPAADLADEGTAAIGVLTPSPGGGTSATLAFSVTDAPLAKGSVSITANEGQSFSGVLANFADANAASAVGDFTAMIDWNDGTTSPGTVVMADPSLFHQTGGAFGVQGTHTYAVEGAYHPRISILDKGGATTSVTSMVTVPDGSLSVTAATHVAAPYGSPVTGLRLATFTDAGGAEQAANYTASIDWGDASPTSTGTVSLSGGVFTIAGSHTFPLPGSYFVNVTAVSKGGSSNATKVEVLVGTDIERFITQAYHDLLARAPDAAGLAYWAGLFNSGTPRSQVATALSHSDEYYGNIIIAPAYRKYLGRDSDAAGIKFWVGQMRNGLTDEQLEAGFIASPEYYAHNGGTDKGWIDGTYQDLLGRAPDSTGEAFWISIAGTIGRAGVALGFAKSPEREKEHVTSDYRHYLSRSPDLTGLDFWSDQFINHGRTNEDLIAGFIGSDEYFQQAILPAPFPG